MRDSQANCSTTQHKTRSFAALKSYQEVRKGESSNSEAPASIKGQRRKWVTKKFSKKAETSDSSKNELDCLSQLKASNQEILSKHQRKSVSHPVSLPTIAQDVETCDDCGGATETEDDSGIFTSSNHSKYSIDDEMIENDVPSPTDNKDESPTTTKNFGSDSDEICSRETSPIQLLADLLRKSPDKQDAVDGKVPETSSLVKLRKLQFESHQSDQAPPGNQRKFVSLRQKNLDRTKLSEYDQISNCDLQISNNNPKSIEPDENEVKMDSSMVSNASRLSICTDCTGGSEENENKFFDDDYTDQQQLILNNQEDERSYHEVLFERMDSFLLSKKEEQEPESKETENFLPTSIQKTSLPKVQRVQEILSEDSCQRSRKESVNTLSSLDSDLCMLDLEEK